MPLLNPIEGTTQPRQGHEVKYGHLKGIKPYILSVLSLYAKRPHIAPGREAPLDILGVVGVSRG